MTPALIALIISAAEALLKEAPTLAADIGALLSKKDPTEDEIKALKTKYGVPYDEL